MENIKRVNLFLKSAMFMKKYHWLVACLFTLSAGAQEKLVLMGKAPDLYVIHTVTTEESLQKVSNQFGQSVTKLSTYNGLNANTVLSKGAQIKIPLTEYNLIRTKGDGNSAPIYHIIEKGDNLFALSKANKISMATIREWNGLKEDAVKLGQAVIIGYMVNARVSDTKPVETKKEEPVKNTTEPVTVKTETKPLVKKEELPLKKTQVTVTPKTEATTSIKTEGALTKNTVEIKKPELPTEYVPKEGDEGYFASPYTQHPKDKVQQFHSGDAATFKTISGWTDRKYYVLINDIAPETIVRITAPNNKSICAKVLGPLQETKGASGLLLRMSNSAASTLGITDPRFTVTVTHFE
jgi:LysM repeat protein